MCSPTVRKWKNCQMQGLHSPDTLDFACKKKNVSTLDNLTKAAQTILVQAGGLDKLDRLATLAPVKVTTLDTRQHLSMLGDSTNS